NKNSRLFVGKRVGVGFLFDVIDVQALIRVQALVLWCGDGCGDCSRDSGGRIVEVN
ncbi:MAG: hypothetical protein ACJAVI_002374, partial [Candidatus Azotimanducaceae bacterium]